MLPDSAEILYLVTLNTVGSGLLKRKLAVKKHIKIKRKMTGWEIQKLNANVMSDVLQMSNSKHSWLLQRCGLLLSKPEIPK